MRLRTRLAALTVWLTLSTAGFSADYAPSEVLVRFRLSVAASSMAMGAASVGTLPRSAADALQSVGALQIRPLGVVSSHVAGLSAASLNGFEPLSRTYRVSLPPGADVQAAIQRLQANAAVEIAEPNARMSFSRVPNDPIYSEQWAFKNTGQVGAKDAYDPATGLAGHDMDSELAWDATTGNASVIVAVIDSGIDYSHPDLATNVWTNLGEIPGNHIDDDNNGFVDDVRGWDFASWDNNPADDCGSPSLGEGHGTHVSGIIAAVGNNGTGVSGNAWTAKVMPLKVAATGCDLFTSDVVNAIQYATNQGAKVINMSLGGGDTVAFHTAVDAAKAAGVTVVAAAGNQGDSTPIYPAAYPSVIGVAATDRRDSRASFSAFGSWVSLAAPGVAIRSTYPTADGSYAYLSGTSMASPMVAGVAALVLSQYPGLTPDQVKARLTNSCEDVSATNVGAGRINAARALLNLATVSPLITTAGINTTFTLTGTAFESGMSVRLSRAGSTSISATSVVVANHQSATCQFNIPYTSSGTWNVEVVAGKTVVTASATIFVEGIELTGAAPSVWPGTGMAGPIILSGRNFGSNLSAYIRHAGQQITASSITVLTSTSAQVSFDVTGAAGGRWDVVISSSGAESVLSRGLAVTTGLYQVVSPPVSSASQYLVSVPQGSIQLDWPASASASPVNIDIDAAPTFPTLERSRDPYVATGIGVALEVVGGQSLFDRSFRLTIPYRSIDLQDARNEEALTLAYYNTTTRRWQPISDVTVNEGVRAVSGSAAHFSYFQLVQHVPENNLDKVIAYPSPFRPDLGHDRIIFDFLTAGARVKIFDLAGHLVTELSDDDGDGRIDWVGVTNQSGEKIASGVYYYVATAGRSTRTGRLAVVR